MSQPEKVAEEIPLEVTAGIATEVIPPQTSGFVRLFDAFADSNFSWFFSSLMGNFAAMNIQMFIRGWLVFEITGSYAKLGYMSAAGGIVGIVFAPLGGVLADRIRQKKHLIQFLQLINAITTLAIALLIEFGRLEFDHLLVAAVVQGVAMNTMMPARQAMPAEIVSRSRLTNAIALNTSGMNGARLLVPGLAGFMVAALGGGNGNIDPAKWVYYVMTLLYIWSMIALLPIRVDDRAIQLGKSEPILAGIIDGFRYCLTTRLILMLLGANFAMVFFSQTYFLLLPGFAKEVLDAGPDRLGLLISISGMGSLVGSLMVAGMKDRHRGRVLLASCLLMGIGLVLFAISTNYWFSLVVLTIVGLGQAGRMSLSNVLIQAYVDDDYRGRVMSIYMLEFSLLQVAIYPISVLADLVGPQWAVAISGIFLIGLTWYLYRIPSYRDLD